MYKKFLLIGSGNFVNEIKGTLQPLALEVAIANEYPEISSKLKNINIALFDRDSYFSDPAALKNIFKLLHRSRVPFVVFSGRKNSSDILEAQAAGASDYILKPYNLRELNLRLSAILNNKKRIACIGGGTGLFNLLMGIKNLPAILPVSIVSTTDDGGSSGRLRESFGVLPPGDIRRSLVALSNAPQIMNEIMIYRFKKSNCFRGHNFGNLLLTVLNDITGSMSDAVKTLSDILNINGIVLPVSSTESTLCARFEGGRTIRGESNIDLGRGRPEGLHIKDCWHEPESKGDMDAYSAIINSDIVTIGPGDLFTSVITNLLIKDIREAIAKTRASKIYICNLMTKPGETDSYDAFDHIKDVLKYLKEDCLDYIIISDNERLSMDAMVRYSKKKQFLVKIGDTKKIRKITKARIIITDVAHETELIRHDNDKIRNVMARIIKSAGKKKG